MIIFDYEIADDVQKMATENADDSNLLSSKTHYAPNNNVTISDTKKRRMVESDGAEGTGIRLRYMFDRPSY